MGKVILTFCFLLALGGFCDATRQTDPPLRSGDSADEVSAARGSSRQPSSARRASASGSSGEYPATYHPARYLPNLTGKSLALVVNQTSVFANGTHLVDSLLTMGQDVRRIFAPEHGFRGGADAGASVADGIDVDTNIPIRSLYGRSKKPGQEDLSDVDLIVFDIQDVGARFYTYISTLHYVMESAARYGVPVLVLDRPNPNGHYIDGPVRQPGYESFLGLDPIPVVHGLTVGEYARMVNGESWLGEGLTCELTVIPCQEGYTHDSVYELPVAPSPNLPNQRSIYLYPSLCFFEGTAVSEGRYTDHPFQLYGHPQLTSGPDTFTPRREGSGAHAKLGGKLCYGYVFDERPAEGFRRNELNLEYLIDSHRELTERGVTFFTRPDFFDLLAGTDELRKLIVSGADAATVRASYQTDLAAYQKIREKYLLYSR